VSSAQGHRAAQRRWGQARGHRAALKWKKRAGAAASRQAEPGWRAENRAQPCRVEEGRALRHGQSGRRGDGTGPLRHTSRRRAPGAAAGTEEEVVLSWGAGPPTVGVFTHLPLLRMASTRKPFLRLLLQICHSYFNTHSQLPFSLMWHAMTTCHAGTRTPHRHLHEKFRLCPCL
jgi:hypothetical protein